MNWGSAGRGPFGRFWRRRTHSCGRATLLGVALLAATACGRAPTAVPSAPVASAQSQTEFFFVAEPPVVAPGHACLLRWNIQGATSVTIEEASGSGKLHPIGEFGGSGTLEVRPETDSTYVVSCNGSAAFSCASVSVRVRTGPP